MDLPSKPVGRPPGGQGVEFLPNCYWEDGCDDRTQLKCIRMTTLRDGKRKKDILLLNQDDEEYSIVVNMYGTDHIDVQTAERRQRKANEATSKRVLHEQKRKSKELEDLFNLKLQAFEIEEVKNNPDRKLRSRMRAAKSRIELQALTTLAIGKALEYF